MDIGEAAPYQPAQILYVNDNCAVLFTSTHLLIHASASGKLQVNKNNIFNDIFFTD